MSTLEDILVLINQQAYDNQQLREALKRLEAEKAALEKKMQTLEAVARDAGIVRG